MADFKIGDREYDFPESFKLGDPILVEAVTGMKFKTWAAQMSEERQASLEEGDDFEGYSPASFIGLIAVAIWRGNPRWSRDKVVQYVQQIDEDALVIEAPPEPAEEETADPPALLATSEPVS